MSDDKPSAGGAPMPVPRNQPGLTWRCALTVIGCRRAGLGDVTLVRDESGSALDPENTRAYAAMLRQAAAEMGARHVLVVSHQEGFAALADARLRVVDGRVEVA